MKTGNELDKNKIQCRISWLKSDSAEMWSVERGDGADDLKQMKES